MTMGFLKRLKPVKIVPGIIIKNYLSIKEFHINFSLRKNARSVEYQVFDKNEPYSGGITLLKNIKMSGNNLTTRLIVFRTDQTVYPAAGKNIYTDLGVNCYYWLCESEDQNVNAMDTRAKLPDTTVIGGQYQVDISDKKKLKLTKTNSDEEISGTDLQQILADGQRLVVIYPVADASLIFY